MKRTWVNLIFKKYIEYNIVGYMKHLLSRSSVEFDFWPFTKVQASLEIMLQHWKKGSGMSKPVYLSGFAKR